MPKVILLYDAVLDVGGVEAHLLSIVSRMSSHNHFLIVSPVTKRFMQKAEAAGAKVVAWQPRTPVSISYLTDLIRLFKYEKPSLIHIHSPNAAVMGRIAAAALRIPCIITTHLPASLYHGERQTIRARLGRFIYTWLDAFFNFSFTDKIVFVSHQVYQEAITRRHAPQSKSTVIPNGIDVNQMQCIDERAGTRETLSTPQDKVVIGFAGRLDRQKGLDILLDAIAKLPGQVHNYEVWLIGEGSQKDDLVNQARLLRIDTRIKFLGYQSQIPQLFSACDLFVLPSRYEALSITLLEALSMGLPGVVTDVGDNRLVIEDGINGLIVPPENVTALANAMQKVLAYPEVREEMSRAAKIKALDFDITQMIASLEGIYGQVLKQTGKNTAL